MELSKALSHTDYTVKDAEKFPSFPLSSVDSTSFMASSEAAVSRALFKIRNKYIAANHKSKL